MLLAPFLAMAEETRGRLFERIRSHYEANGASQSEEAQGARTAEKKGKRLSDSKAATPALAKSQRLTGGLKAGGVGWGGEKGWELWERGRPLGRKASGGQGVGESA